MSILTTIAYFMATFNFLFYSFMGGYFFLTQKSPLDMIVDKNDPAGLKIADMLFTDAPELSRWALASSYLIYAMMIPAIATAPRWARCPPTFMFAFHMMYALTYHEARLIAPTPYPTENVVIHSIVSIGMLLLIALPEPQAATKIKGE